MTGATDNISVGMSISGQYYHRYERIGHGSASHYFETLSKDIRYQLTVVNSTFAQAIVSKKVSGNTFQLRTNKPNTNVSWQVTNIRKGANAHRIQPEVEKGQSNKGKYLNPVELKNDLNLGKQALQPKSGSTR